MTVKMVAAPLVTVALLGAGAPARQEGAPRIIHMSAERFSFTPSEIRIQVAEEVELRISSEDTSHGFHVAGTNIGAVVPKRGQGEVYVRVRLERPGRYEF